MNNRKDIEKEGRIIKPQLVEEQSENGEQQRGVSRAASLLSPPPAFTLHLTLLVNALGDGVLFRVPDSLR